MLDLPQPPGLRPSRLGLYLPVVLLGLAALAWSAFWVATRNAAEHGLDAWLASEAAQNRAWACPERVIAGYPFRIEITCAHPTFSGAAAGEPIEVALASLHAVTQIYQPTLFLVDFEGPIVVRDARDQTSGRAAFAHLRASVRTAPEGAQRAALIGDGLTFALDRPGRASVSGTAASFEAHARRDLDQPANAADIAVAAAGVASPDLTAATGLDTPASLELAGVLREADALAGQGPWAERLELWRRAKGELVLRRIAATQGAAHAEGSGALTLDEAHRPAGRIDAEASGVAPLLNHWGAPPAAAMALGALFSGGGGAAGKPKRPASTALPLAIAEGRLTLGPLTLPGLVAPLY